MVAAAHRPSAHPCRHALWTPAPICSFAKAQTAKREQAAKAKALAQERYRTAQVREHHPSLHAPAIGLDSSSPAARLTSSHVAGLTCLPHVPCPLKAKLRAEKERQKVEAELAALEAEKVALRQAEITMNRL